jgi:hypothetical protein
MVAMKTVSIGRRLGDWLGLVPEAEERRPEPVRAPDDQAPSRHDVEVRVSPVSEPPRGLLSFREVVNQRRSAGLERSAR